MICYETIWYNTTRVLYYISYNNCNVIWYNITPQATRRRCGGRGSTTTTGPSTSTGPRRYNMIRYKSVQILGNIILQNSAIQHNIILYYTIQNRTIQYNVISYDTIQYSAKQYNRIQYCDLQAASRYYPVRRHAKKKDKAVFSKTAFLSWCKIIFSGTLLCIIYYIIGIIMFIH